MTATTTIQEPAPLLERVDCGSGFHYGICPKCGRGHGYKIDLTPETADRKTEDTRQESPPSSPITSNQ